MKLYCSLKTQMSICEFIVHNIILCIDIWIMMCSMILYVEMWIYNAQYCFTYRDIISFILRSMIPCVDIWFILRHISLCVNNIRIYKAQYSFIIRFILSFHNHHSFNISFAMRSMVSYGNKRLILRSMTPYDNIWIYNAQYCFICWHIVYIVHYGFIYSHIVNFAQRNLICRHMVYTVQYVLICRHIAS